MDPIIKPIKIKQINTGYIITIKCPFCNKFHKHGTNNIINLDEHRISHCTRGGYFIKN
jgi:hypothetical protein